MNKKIGFLLLCLIGLFYTTPGLALSRKFAEKKRRPETQAIVKKQAEKKEQIQAHRREEKETVGVSSAKEKKLEQEIEAKKRQIEQLDNKEDQLEAKQDENEEKLEQVKERLEEEKRALEKQKLEKERVDREEKIAQQEKEKLRLEKEKEKTEKELQAKQTALEEERERLAKLAIVPYVPPQKAKEELLKKLAEQKLAQEKAKAEKQLDSAPELSAKIKKTLLDVQTTQKDIARINSSLLNNDQRADLAEKIKWANKNKLPELENDQKELLDNYTMSNTEYTSLIDQAKTLEKALSDLNIKLNTAINNAKPGWFSKADQLAIEALEANLTQYQNEFNTYSIELGTLKTKRTALEEKLTQYDKAFEMLFDQVATSKKELAQAKKEKAEKEKLEKETLEKETLEKEQAAAAAAELEKKTKEKKEKEELAKSNLENFKALKANLSLLITRLVDTEEKTRKSLLEANKQDNNLREWLEWAKKSTLKPLTIDLVNVINFQAKTSNDYKNVLLAKWNELHKALVTLKERISDDKILKDDPIEASKKIASYQKDFDGLLAQSNEIFNNFNKTNIYLKNFSDSFELLYKQCMDAGSAALKTAREEMTSLQEDVEEIYKTLSYLFWKNPSPKNYADLETAQKDLIDYGEALKTFSSNPLASKADKTKFSVWQEKREGELAPYFKKLAEYEKTAQKDELPPTPAPEEKVAPTPVPEEVPVPRVLPTSPPAPEEVPTSEEVPAPAPVDEDKNKPAPAPETPKPSVDLEKQTRDQEKLLDEAKGLLGDVTLLVSQVATLQENIKGLPSLLQNEETKKELKDDLTWANLQGIEDLEKSLNKLLRDFKESKEPYNDMVGEMSTLAKKLDTLKKELGSDISNASKGWGILKVKTEAVKKLETELPGFQKGFDTCSKNFKSLEETYDMLSGYGTTLTNLRENVEQTKKLATLKNPEELATALLTRAEGLNTQVDTALKGLDEKRKTFAVMKKKLLNQKEQEGFEEDLNWATEKNLNNLVVLIKQLQEDNERNKTRYETMVSQKHKLTKGLSNLQSDLPAAIAKATELKKRKWLSAVMASKEPELIALQKDIETIQNSFDGLNEQLGTFNTLYAELDDTLEKYLERFNGLVQSQEYLDALKQQSDASRQQKIESKRAAWETNVSDKEAGVQKQITAMQKTVTDSASLESAEQAKTLGKIAADLQVTVENTLVSLNKTLKHINNDWPSIPLNANKLKVLQNGKTLNIPALTEKITTLEKENEENKKNIASLAQKYKEETDGPVGILANLTKIQTNLGEKIKTWTYSFLGGYEPPLGDRQRELAANLSFFKKELTALSTLSAKYRSLSLTLQDFEKEFRALEKEIKKVDAEKNKEALKKKAEDKQLKQTITNAIDKELFPPLLEKFDAPIAALTNLKNRDTLVTANLGTLQKEADILIARLTKNKSTDLETINSLKDLLSKKRDLNAQLTTLTKFKTAVDNMQTKSFKNVKTQAQLDDLKTQLVKVTEDFDKLNKEADETVEYFKKLYTQLEAANNLAKKNSWWGTICPSFDTVFKQWNVLLLPPPLEQQPAEEPAEESTEILNAAV